MPLPSNPKILCFGEILLRLTTTRGEGIEGLPDLSCNIGGAEANVAVGMRNLGHEVRMVSCLPQNAFGTAALQHLRRFGVDVDSILRADGRMGLYFLIPGAIHRPSEIIYDRSGSAFAEYDFSTIDWQAELAGVTCLHVSGITPALGDRCTQAVIEAMTVARKEGVQVSFDCNYRPRLWGAWTERAPSILKDLMSRADIVFGGHRDIELALGETLAGASGNADRSQAAADLAFTAFPGLKRLVGTDRAQISVDHNRLTGMLFTADRCVRSAAYDVPGIVDRIGGGDAFAAGVLHGILTGESEQQALAFGMAATCLKHAQKGDMSLAGHQDLMNFLNATDYDVRR